MTTATRSLRYLCTATALAGLVGCASGARTAADGGPATASHATGPTALLLDSLVRAHLELDPGIPGAQVAVWHEGRVILSRGYGTAEIEAGRAVEPGTVFRLASVTKQFTAAAIVQLAEEGVLSLDDPLARWVPEYPTGGHEVTLRHLLTNTSGIPNFATVDPDWQAKIGEPLPPMEALARMSEHDLLFEPGDRFDYSNTGYVLLGIVIERASGMSYDEYVRDALAHRHGFGSLAYCPDTPAPGHAHGYRPEEEGSLPALPVSMTNAYSAGALCSTAEDLVRWTQALNRGRIVAPALVEEMVTPPEVRTGRTPYGFGLVIGSLAGHRRVMHGGGINGFNTQVAYYPEHDLGIAVLYNTSGSPPARLELLLARAVLGLELPTVVSLPTPAEVRAAYTGTYSLAGTQLRVFERDEMLWAQVAGQAPGRILFRGDHEFVAVYDPGVRFVFEIDGERATGFVLHQGGATVPATRME
jgi:D-alanyl-D-alanine carboxypeptidase